MVFGFGVCLIFFLESLGICNREIMKKIFKMLENSRFSCFLYFCCLSVLEDIIIFFSF